MVHFCFKQGCEVKAQYLCLCLCSETYCCEIHLETHLKLGYRTHTFNSILTEPSEWTKVGVLKFLANEKLKKEILKKIDLGTCTKNCYKSIEDMSSDLDVINDLIEKFTQVSENSEEKKALDLLILTSNTNSERVEIILPEPYRSVILFCRSSQIRYKKWALLNRVNNDLETEQDFRKTCALYENLASDPLFSQVYQEYINAYHKITSLYHISTSSALKLKNVRKLN